MSDNNIHISDAAFEDVHNFLLATRPTPPTDVECQNAIEEVLLNAAAFYHLFCDYPFIFEPVHDFEGLITREGELNHFLNLRMVLSGDRMYIRSPEECPVDPMYEVRKVITEAHFPAFQPNDDPPKESPA